MFRHLKPHAAADGGEAGKTAGDARAQESAIRQDQKAARLAASERCDVARRRLAAAQHMGDPAMITAGHRELEAALKALRRSSIACDSSRQAFLGETEPAERADEARRLSR